MRLLVWLACCIPVAWILTEYIHKNVLTLTTDGVIFLFLLLMALAYLILINLKTKRKQGYY